MEKWYESAFFPAAPCSRPLATGYTPTPSIPLLSLLEPSAFSPPFPAQSSSASSPSCSAPRVPVVKKTNETKGLKALATGRDQIWGRPFVCLWIPGLSRGGWIEAHPQSVVVVGQVALHVLLSHCLSVSTLSSNLSLYGPQLSAQECGKLLSPDLLPHVAPRPPCPQGPKAQTT
jgi:hypothetical protein